MDNQQLEFNFESVPSITEWTINKTNAAKFHTSPTGAVKEVKLARYDLIPPDFLRALAEHYGKGAEKYDDNNWKKGYDYHYSYAAMQRHATAWWNGEDDDKEFDDSHLVAVAWHAIALWWFKEHGKGTDDRPGNDSTGHNSREAHELFSSISDGIGNQSPTDSTNSYRRVSYTSPTETRSDLTDEVYTPRPNSNHSIWYCSARIDGNYLTFAAKSKREVILAVQSAIREKGLY